MDSLRWQQTTLNGTTSETTILAADSDAKKRRLLAGLLITNKSATALNVTIRDDTAGTVLCVIPVPANDIRGFMPPAPICPDEPNTPWTAQSDQSVDRVEITAFFRKM